MDASIGTPLGGRYDITEQGRLDLLTLEQCNCQPRVIGLLVQCPSCGTVYGHQADLELKKQQVWHRFRYGR